MAAPSLRDKLSLGLRDGSYLRHESLLTIVRHAIMMLMVGLVAWAMVSALSLSVKHANAWLFSPFQSSKAIVVSQPATRASQPLTSEAQPAHRTTCQMHTHGAPLNALMCQYTAWFFLGVILLGSLVRALLVRSSKWRSVEGDGATHAIAYFLESYKKPAAVVVQERYSRSTFMEAVRRVLITAMTLGCGGSGGLEGPAIPIGEAIGATWGKWLRVQDPDTLRAMQISGIAAALSCVLNAPFAAAIFAVEIVYSERIVVRTFLYSVFAVITVHSLNIYFNMDDLLFMMPYHPNAYTLSEYALVMLVAVFCSAPTGLGLKVTFFYLKGLFHRIPVMLRAPLGAMMAAGIALGLWFALGLEPQYVLGMGERTISDLLNLHGNSLLQVWWVLLAIVLAKTLTTGLTLMTGGSAGLLIPAMILGGVMGAGIHAFLMQWSWLNLAGSELFIVVGTASSLVAVIEVPIASIALAIEVFGVTFAPPVMLAVAISYFVARNLRHYAEKKWGLIL